MACVTAKMFKAFLDSQEVKNSFVDDEQNVIRVGWNLHNTSITMLFSFDEDDHDVHIQGFDFLKVAEENYAKSLKVVNDLNQKYRWVKFTLDTERGMVAVEDDAIIDVDTCAAEVNELMLRMAHIVDESYPVFMKAMWS